MRLHLWPQSVIIMWMRFAPPSQVASPLHSGGVDSLSPTHHCFLIALGNWPSLPFPHLPSAPHRTLYPTSSWIKWVLTGGGWATLARPTAPVQTTLTFSSCQPFACRLDGVWKWVNRAWRPGLSAQLPLSLGTIAWETLGGKLGGVGAKDDNELSTPSLLALTPHLHPRSCIILRLQCLRSSLSKGMRHKLTQAVVRMQAGRSRVRCFNSPLGVSCGRRLGAGAYLTKEEWRRWCWYWRWWWWWC